MKWIEWIGEILNSTKENCSKVELSVCPGVVRPKKAEARTGLYPLSQQWKLIRPTADGLSLEEHYYIEHVFISLAGARSAAMGAALGRFCGWLAGPGMAWLGCAWLCLCLHLSCFAWLG